MKFAVSIIVLFVAIIFAVAACEIDEEKKLPNSNSKNNNSKKVISKVILTKNSESKDKDVEDNRLNVINLVDASIVSKNEPKTDDPRQELLLKEYEKYTDTVVTHSFALLTGQEKKMLTHLLNAASLIKQLNMLQLHPENLKWKQQIEENGTEIEKKVFFRYQSPWCVEDSSIDCNVLASKPAKKIGHIHWPVNFTDAQYKGLKNKINANELLSPFTIVRMSLNQKLEAIAYSQTNEFGLLIKEMSLQLREAAKYAPDKSLENFLKSRADSFEIDGSYPFDDSDYNWIVQKGDWEVMVGPFDTKKNPHQLKASFGMLIGHENKKITAELLQFKKNIQDVENVLSQLIGEDIYKSKKLDARIAIRAVDIWMASGNVSADNDVVASFSLIHRGKAENKGLYKKVIMVNRLLAFEPITKVRAGFVLNVEQLKYVNSNADVTNATFREFAHTFGAYNEMKITNLKGKATTVKHALKDLSLFFEEAKAYTFGLWLISYQKKNEWITEYQEKTRYVSAIMHLLGKLQYDAVEKQPSMASVQLGWYLDTGALLLNKKTKKFTVVFSKMPSAVESFAKKIATIQLTGNYENAKQLVSQDFFNNEQGEYLLSKLLKEIKNAMIINFELSNIKKTFLRYEITDFVAGNPT